MGVLVKTRKEDVGIPEAPPLAKDGAALTQTKEVAPHCLATGQPPKGVVVEP